MYRWWNYLHARVHGKVALRISLDETSVKFWPSSNAVGNLYVGFGRTRGQPKQPLYPALASAMPDRV